VTNLRGEILTVLDLRELFGIARKPSGEADRASSEEEETSLQVIVLGSASAEFGVIADEVEQVSILRATDVLPAPPSLIGRAGEYVRGVSVKAQLILNGEALLNDEQLIIDQRD